MNTKHVQKMKGVVVSAKMHKTVVVAVSRLKKHPRYKKYMRITRRYKAHAEPGMVEEGDRVIISSTRPVSREVHWKVEEKV